MAIHFRRRELIVTLGVAAAWPLAARTQQSAKPIVGLMHATAQPNDDFAAAPGGTTSRIDLQKFSGDPVKVATLKKAVAAMKARKQSDPTSWFFQAAIHGVTPAAIATAQQEDPGISQVDQQKWWNQCPHFNNASSAEFLI